MRMTVAMLYLAGCPNYLVADQRPREALVAVGRAGTEVEHVLVPTEQEPKPRHQRTDRGRHGPQGRPRAPTAGSTAATCAETEGPQRRTCHAAAPPSACASSRRGRQERLRPPLRPLGPAIIVA